MNKKLRLLVADKCNRNCPKCCNKLYDLDKLPIVTNYDQYDEIIFTGGEPMLNPDFLMGVIDGARTIRPGATLYLQTAKVDEYYKAAQVLDRLNGMTVTLHESADINHLVMFNKFIPDSFRRDKSLRVSVSSKMIKESWWDYKKLNHLQGWEIKFFEFEDECPVPEGEDFKRIKCLM